MENEAASKVESPEDATGPGNPQLALNGDGAEMDTNDDLVVIENVTDVENKTTAELQDGSATEKSETQSGAGAEPDESSEKSSHPVSALETEPKNILPEQQAVSQNDPEPSPAKTHLADGVPESEPEKTAESVPQAETPEPTLPEPATLQQSVDPPIQEDKVPEPAQSQAAMEAGAEQVAKQEEPKIKDAAEPTKEVGEEKQEEKKVEETTSEKTPEPEKEEETDPAPGSLSFPILEKEQTKDALRASRTLVALRGLPGSGKSFLARAIADAYKDSCTIICADSHGVKPENPDAPADAYKALDEAIVACCSGETVLVVVDDTNHTQDRLARLEEIAEENDLVAVFLEPQTEWRAEPAQLMKKTKRGLDEARLKAMKGQLDEMSIPLYFGWFLLPASQKKIVCTSGDFLKTLDTLEAFKKRITDFMGKDEKEVDLEQYFETKGPLHCTTKFCDYGKAEGAKEYATKPAVREFYGSASELALTALFVTPRTVGARVTLTEEQLQLWPADAEKEAESVVPAAASMALGSRAHITLGCAAGVEPVQTGLDLLEILALQLEGQQGETVEEMALGTLTYYGNGRWLLGLREPICASACFSSYYKRKEGEPTKKEPEKKKKQKCTIL